MSDQSLLPPNATALEKSLALLALRVTALPIPFLSLHRVDNCPATYLPWLAWARRVEYWNPDWSISQKRMAIASARTFNQQRGTRASMQTLLAQVIDNKPYTLVAWHELTPKGQPFTFSVRLDPTDPLSIEQLAQIHSAVDATKSARDLYGVQARVQQQSTFFTAGAAIEGQRVSISTGD